MPTPPIKLDEYRNERIIKFTRGEKYLMLDILDNYRRLHTILLRQLGHKDYKGGFEEKEFGEKSVFEILDPKQKMDLENIAIKLGEIIESVEKILK